MNAPEGCEAPPRLAENRHGESAHVFGDGLVGVLSKAAGAAPQRTAVILFNAGLVQRSGPHRGYVQLARALAERGFPVLRFDRAGLGDSLPPSARVADQRRAELRAAMELLAQRCGAQRFVVGGICSAADHAFRIAADEPRVRGLLLFDGLAYRTAGYWLRYLPPRVLHPGRLWRWWRQRGGEADMANFRDFPPRAEAVARLRELVARDVRLLFVFTGGAYLYFNHAGQLRACLGAAACPPQVYLAYWPDCDHTFYLQRDRARLRALVADWLQREFAPA